MIANLCKCNNCDNVLIDQNPQVNAPQYELKGNELEMQFFNGGVEPIEEERYSGLFWGCPVCLTDGYLTDL